MRVNLHCGDSLEWLRTLPDASVDAVVTDPPAGIAFMGAAWDRDKGGRDAWIAWLCEVMREVWRVTKPGGHALVWALPRTQHWTATAVEDAGWDVRDVLMHVFGSGFPKSLNLPGGWGTALKPSHEAWILARKPLAGTVAANVLAHGTGALNIDGTRVTGGEAPKPTTAPGWDSINRKNADSGYRPSDYHQGGAEYQPSSLGRWPPHLLLSHAAACGETCADGCPVAEMDTQSGVSAAKPKREGRQGGGRGVVQFGTIGGDAPGVWPARGGGASQFFPVFRYVAKPSTAEKTCAGTVENRHLTAKSITLMRWLVRLITPPGGLVLDPFLGSGTTGVAAVSEGHAFMGCDLSPEFVAVARQRIEHALAGVGIEQTGEAAATPEPKNGQISMW